MKRLIIIRHAKSSWDNVNLTDFERNLSSTWIKEIKFVSKILKKLDLETDLILCSSAHRARATLEWLWEELDAKDEKIIFEKWIYENNGQQLCYYLKLLSEITDDKKDVVLIGHNPFVSVLVDFLSWANIGEIWTLWIVIINFDIKKWQEINNTKWVINMFINTWNL